MSKRVHIVPGGFHFDGADSGKSLEWLEKSYLELESYGRVECPACKSRQLTILDVECPNCHIVVAKNRQPIDKDGTAKLAGGMTAGELMKRAEKWWDHKGRKYFRRVRSRVGDSIAQTEELQSSGILMGRKFNDLTRAQKFSVCKAYHLSWYEQENSNRIKKPIVI